MNPPSLLRSVEGTIGYLVCGGCGEDHTVTESDWTVNPDEASMSYTCECGTTFIAWYHDDTGDEMSEHTGLVHDLAEAHGLEKRSISVQRAVIAPRRAT